MPNHSDRNVHLVGSVPLGSADDVFDLISDHLGRCCHRIPDGETGERRNWIGWQLGVFERQAALIQQAEKDRDYQLHPPFAFAPGKDVTDLDFSDLGFARSALASFPLFRDRQQRGEFSEEARFLVAIPTPFAPVYSFTAYACQADILPVYEAAILREIGQICDAIPADRLALQWDVATEMSIFEQVYPAPFPDAWAVLMNQLVRLGDAISGQIDLGYHLCYGSMNNRHWEEPDDLNMCVRVANALIAALGRPVNFLHMPVPIDRADPTYFAPLADLRMGRETELFLGLIHDRDSDADNRARMDAARAYLEDFGLATECGLGRRDEADVPNLLSLHARLARP